MNSSKPNSDDNTDQGIDGGAGDDAGAAVVPDRRWLTVIAFVVVLALDLATKTWVRSALDIGERITAIDNLLEWRHIENTGFAFGLLGDQTTIVRVATIVVAALLIVIIWRLPLHDRTTALGAGMLAGGALGNLIDRAWLGYVTDFIHLPPMAFFQTFNIADMGIVFGVTLVIIGQLRTRHPI